MKDVILHAFNWKYRDIINRLGVIKESGFGAILIPPIIYSNPDNGDWWQRYQPIDYRILLSHLGTKKELEELIKKAHGQEIRIYADIVLNHMENRSTDKYCAPGDVELNNYAQNKADYEANRLYGDISTGLFSEFDFNEHRNITDWNNRYDVQYHQLSDLPDLNENLWVLKQQRDLFYALNQMHFDGYRLDAIKHLTEHQLNNVTYQHFLQDSYIFGEVLTTNETQVEIFMKPYLAETNLSAYDFPLQEQLRIAFGYGGSLKLLVDPFKYGKALHWSRAVTFTINHDLPLNDGFRSLMLSAKDEFLANVYIICRDGGVPLVFSDNNESSSKHPEDKDRWAGAYCNRDIKAMIQFHNEVAGLPMRFLYEHDNYLVFCRGDKGIVAINKSDEWVNADVWLYGLRNPATYIELLKGYRMTLNGQAWLSLSIAPRSAQIWLCD